MQGPEGVGQHTQITCWALREVNSIGFAVIEGRK
jgi:hypothetical protein